MSTDRETWVMPEWMEPLRGVINNTGGNSIEELLNDTKTNVRSNAIRAALIIAVDSQVKMLTALHRLGVLDMIAAARVPVLLELDRVATSKVASQS